MVNRALLTVCFVVIGLSLTWAAGEQEEAGAAEKTYTLKFWRAGLDEGTRNFYQSEIDRYQSANPNVTIEFSEYDWGDTMETKLNMGFASGTGPDVVRYVISSIAHRVSQGHYHPLEEYIESWDEADDIVQTAYNIGSYKGTRYGITVQTDPMFVIFRKDFYEEAGLDPDDPPTTWEELKEASRKLVIRDGDTVERGGIGLPTAGRGHHRFIMLSRQKGAKLVDYEKDIPTFNEPRAVEALEYLASYNKEKLLVPYRMGGTETPPFRQGRAAQAFGHRGEVTRVLQIHPEWEGQIGYCEVNDEEKSSFAGAQIYFIAGDSEKKDEGWEFIKFLMDKETLWNMYEEKGTLPVRNSLKERFVADNPELHNIVFNALGYGEGNPKVTWSPLFVKYIDNAYEQAMYGEDPKAALDEAVRLLLEDLES